MCCCVNMCAYLTATIAYPAVLHSYVIFRISIKAITRLLNKNHTGGWSVSNSLTGETYLHDQISSVGFLLHFLRTKVVCLYCQACSCFIQVTRWSSSPHATVSMLSSVFKQCRKSVVLPLSPNKPGFSSFQCSLCDAKEPLAEFVLKDATANQPENLLFNMGK